MEEVTGFQTPRVKLGSQGLEVSKLGFGCCGLSGVYNNPLSFEEGASVIKHAFEKGVTFFDTSDIYGANYHNEYLVGEALKVLPREKIQLATKFGIIIGENWDITVRGDPAYVRQSCEASLKRLGVDYIDLFYQHRIDTSIPIEDTIGELKKLVKEGKIRYIGLSEASPETIRRANAIHPITAVQIEWSLWSRDVEEEIVPLCRELGIGIVAYSPLGRGFFGGKAVVDKLPEGSMLVDHPRFMGENIEKNKILYSEVERLAIKYGCSTPQLALAWVLNQGDDVVPIPGTTKIKNFDSNIEALKLNLRNEEMKKVSGAVALHELSGMREYGIFASYTWEKANTPAKAI